MSNNRRGYEFSKEVKMAAKERSGGYCEYPGGCTRKHDGTVDHFTAIKIARLLGLDRSMITSLDNAQMLCSYHNYIKTTEESARILQIEMTLEMENAVRAESTRAKKRTAKLAKEYGKLQGKEVQLPDEIRDYIPYYRRPDRDFDYNSYQGQQSNYESRFNFKNAHKRNRRGRARGKQRFSVY